MKFWFLAIFLPGAFAFTDSVWESAKEKQHSANVVVKGISSDGDRVTVTIIPQDSDSENQARETVEMCSLWQGGDAHNLSESERMNLIRQAFAEGRTVKVQFNGNFNRCISKVTL